MDLPVVYKSKQGIYKVLRPRDASGASTSTTRSEDENFDLLGALPVEIAWEVLSYLKPVEFARISLVSKSWRNLTNVDKYWKSFCEAEKIHEEFICYPPQAAASTLEPLCKWAYIYTKYTRNLLSNWKNSTYRTLDLKFDVEYVVIDGPIMVQSYLEKPYIGVFKMVDGEFFKCQMLHPSIPDLTAPIVVSNQNHIAVGCYNFISIYKITDDGYKEQKCFYFLPNENKLHQVKSPADALSSYQEMPNLLIKAVFPDCVWFIDELNSSSFYFNWIENRLIPIKPIFTNYFNLKLETDHNKFVFYQHDNGITVYKINAEEYYKYSGETEPTMLSWNGKYVGFYIKTGNTSQSCIMNLTKKELICDDRSLIGVHPSTDTCYLIQNEILTAKNLLTGEELWTVTLSKNVLASHDRMSYVPSIHEPFVFVPSDRTDSRYILCSKKDGSEITEHRTDCKFTEIYNGFMVTRGYVRNRLKVAILCYF